MVARRLIVHIAYDDAHGWEIWDRDGIDQGQISVALAAALDLTDTRQRYTVELAKHSAKPASNKRRT